MQVFTEQNFDITFHSVFIATRNYGYRHLNTHFSSLILCSLLLDGDVDLRIPNNENIPNEAFTAIIEMF